MTKKTSSGVTWERTERRFSNGRTVKFWTPNEATPRKKRAAKKAKAAKNPKPAGKRKGKTTTRHGSTSHGQQLGLLG